MDDPLTKAKDMKNLLWLHDELQSRFDVKDEFTILSKGTAIDFLSMRLTRTEMNNITLDNEKLKLQAKAKSSSQGTQD